MTGNHRDTFMPSGNGLPSLFLQPPNPNSLRLRIGWGGEDRGGWGEWGWWGGEGLQKVWIWGIANTPRGEILPKEWDPDYYNWKFPTYFSEILYIFLTYNYRFPIVTPPFIIQHLVWLLSVCVWSTLSLLWYGLPLTRGVTYFSRYL